MTALEAIALAWQAASAAAFARWSATTLPRMPYWPGGMRAARREVARSAAAWWFVGQAPLVALGCWALWLARALTHAAALPGARASVAWAALAATAPGWRRMALSYLRPGGDGAAPAARRLDD